MRCNICDKELDKDRRPVVYCDWQQGRCPNQKEKLSPMGYFTITSIFVIFFIVIAFNIIR